MERQSLLSCDALILSSLTNAPSANPDTMLGELCTKMGESMGTICNDSIVSFHSNNTEGRWECSYTLLSYSKRQENFILELKFFV